MSWVQIPPDALKERDFMNKVEEAVYDYLMENVGLWERTLKELDKGNRMYLGVLPPLRGDVSYGDFINKMKQIAKDIKENGERY